LQGESHSIKGFCCEARLFSLLCIFPSSPPPFGLPLLHRTNFLNFLDFEEHASVEEEAAEAEE
jgi:hypothetical protein